MVQGWFKLVRCKFSLVGGGAIPETVSKPYYCRTPYRCQISTKEPLQEETRVNILKVKFFLFCSTCKDMGGVRKRSHRSYHHSRSQPERLERLLSNTPRSRLFLGVNKGRIEGASKLHSFEALHSRCYCGGACLLANAEKSLPAAK